MSAGVFFVLGVAVGIWLAIGAHFLGRWMARRNFRKGAR